MKNILIAGLTACALVTGVAMAGDPAPDVPTGDLKTIMVDLGEQTAKIQAGLWVEDFVAISAGARAVADHPHVSPEERARVQAALGDEFGLFGAGDRKVHDGAVRLAEAADAKDLDATIKSVQALQVDCVSCHTQFRSKLAR